MREREKEREREREKSTRTQGERVREKALWLLLLYVFSSTWACPMQIGLSQECCLFCLKSSLWSSDLPCLLATTILDSFSLFYLPNNTKLVSFSFSFFWPHHRTSEILVPPPGKELTLPGRQVQTLNHWTAREVPW